jgi:O-acetyl-ADP-ribose deacetylase (regulator of RNase III)
MPEISFPSRSLANTKQITDESIGSVPTLTTINSEGTEYYIVTSTAQFMVYGNDQMSSEVRALGSGTLVRMTKPGEQWASIQLPDGSEGVVQNKFLRAASAAESGGQLVTPAGM